MTRRMRFRCLMIAAVVAISALYAAVSCWSVAAWDWLNDSTMYSAGYSEAKFRSVKIGMEKVDVIRILGEPLTERVYESPRTFLDYTKGLGREPSYYSRTIRLDAGGRVEEVYASFIRDGFYFGPPLCGR